MADIAPGVLGRLRVRVNTITGTTANVNLVNNNGVSIGTPVDVPVGLIEVISEPVVVGDVLENVTDGRTGVVRWVDPANSFMWSARTDSTGAISTSGWRKIGTATFF